MEIPVQHSLLGRIQSEKPCICKGNYELHLDVFDVQKRLRTEKVLPAKGILIGPWRTSCAPPGAVRIVHGQKVGIA